MKLIQHGSYSTAAIAAIQKTVLHAKYNNSLKKSKLQTLHHPIKTICGLRTTLYKGTSPAIIILSPWFREHNEVDGGILIGELPALQVAEVLVDVLGEEGREGRHHAGHEEQHRAQSLHRLQTLTSAIFTLP